MSIFKHILSYASQVECRRIYETNAYMSVLHSLQSSDIRLSSIFKDVQDQETQCNWSKQNLISKLQLCCLDGFAFTVSTECTGTQRKCQIVQPWRFETPDPHLKTRFCSRIVPRTGLTLLWRKFYSCGAFTEASPPHCESESVSEAVKSF